jgi:hypothetical protein
LKQLLKQLSALAAAATGMLQVTAASDVVHACTALLSEYCVSDLQDQGSSALGFW